MYVYIRSEPRLWTVGFYKPDGKWQPESDHGDQEAAAGRVTELNGGGKPPGQVAKGGPPLLISLHGDKPQSTIADRRPQRVAFTRPEGGEPVWYTGTVSQDDLFRVLAGAGLITREES